MKQLLMITLLLAGFPCFANENNIIPPPKGEINISVSKANTAQIIGISDMYLPVDSDSIDSTWINTVCVHSPEESPDYSIQAFGSHDASGDFVLTDGEKTVPYNVTWQKHTDNISCKGAMASGAQLIIDLPQETLQVANSGYYAESLTLVISPN